MSAVEKKPAGEAGSGQRERTVRNAIAASELSAVYVGTRILVMREDAQTWLESKKSDARKIVRPDQSQRRKAAAI